MSTIGWLRGRVAELDLDCFAVVMATGIVSSGTADLGLNQVSALLLAAAVGQFALMLLVLVWRLVRFGSRVLADARDPDNAFGYFTVVAAADVVGLDLADYHRLAILGLAVASTPVWLLLAYGIPHISSWDGRHDRC